MTVTYRYPGINGIQVLEQIRKEGYQGYVTMLTCHDDFHYIQQAMRLGANDYILKNELVGEDMLVYLDEISEKIRSDQLKTEIVEDEKERIKREKQHLYKEKFLKNMLQIGGISKEDFHHESNRYQLKIHAEGIYIIIIHMKHWGQIVKRYKDSGLQIFFSTVDQMMKEIFLEYPEWEGFYSDSFRYHILFTCKEEKSAFAVEKRLQRLIKSIANHFERILDIGVAISVYRNTYPVGELYRGYQEALLLLEQSFFWPRQQIFWNGILRSYSHVDMHELGEKLNAAIYEEGRFSETLEEFLKQQKDHLLKRKDFLHVISDSIATLTEKHAVSLRRELDEYDDIQTLLIDIRQMEQELSRERENDSYSFLVKQALQIIKKDFTKKITLAEVAEQLEISAGYFSRIFSGEMKETFSNYVIRKRIEYAKGLIMTTNYKFYEISEMCGFSSPVHFNNTFKKLCGVTPNQFRQNGGK